MATLEGHMTKLEAVNAMLWTIGELPVQSLSSGLLDAEIAEDVLDRVNREIQIKGWHVNTRYAVELTKNADNQFALPVDTLTVDTANYKYGRRTSTPGNSAHINASMRRSQDDTKWLLYDNDNNSETWTNEDTLTVDIVQLKEFANLTPALQNYVWTMAAHRFQKGAMGSRVLHAFTEEDVINAEMQASQDDAANEDLNMIRQSDHVRAIVHRYNPGYNI